MGLNTEHVTKYGNVTEAGLRAGLTQSREYGSDRVQIYVKGKTFWVEATVDGQAHTRHSVSYRIASDSYRVFDSLIAKRERTGKELAEAQAAVSDSSASWHFEQVLELFDEDSEQQKRALRLLAGIAKDLAKAETEVETLENRIDAMDEALGGLMENSFKAVNIVKAADGLQLNGYWGNMAEPSQVARELEYYANIADKAING